MGTGHDHGTHTADRARLGGALAVTATILVAEVVGAWWSGSLALLVDAAHVLTDSLGLVVALVAATLVRRPATSRRTWGWRRAEVIAAAAQAAILTVVGVYALVEGVARLVAPPAVASTSMLLVGVLGLVGNLAAMGVLVGGRHGNLNLRAAFLEVTADALGSVAVVVAAVVIGWTGWTRADAVAGILVAALIVPRAVALLRTSGAMLLETTPAGLDLDLVRAHVLSIDHVVGVHDLHASEVASGLPTLTCHVVLEDRCFADQHCLSVLAQLQQCVATHHAVAIEHCTFQLESRAIAQDHADQLHA